VLTVVNFPFFCSIDSLRKLHRKAQGIDAYFDSNVRTCTMKAAWDKVRDSLERGMDYQQSRCAVLILSSRTATIVEAQVRQEFLTTLANEIIGPLTALKVSQALRAWTGLVRSFLTCPKGIAQSHARAGQTRSQGVCRRTHRFLKKDSQVRGSIH
jgi:hypothetical protein